MKAKSIAKGIESVYLDRKSSLIIGLTGRTGSGCSTVSGILNTPIEGLHLRKAQTPPFSQEDRKYRIVREWTKNNWKTFQQIQVSHIITYFALKESFLDIQNFVKDKVKDEAESNSFTDIKKEINDLPSVFRLPTGGFHATSFSYG